ncbi:LOW QUALITY PROTEIN: F-box protein DOR [Eutrema salsugineum]|uniref:LOW QUALITY PROTEIN: F-box protein DOR n=1 Tax=Eutrema salsugineum TaxID=72664 RepID=UPI000CED4314|nr:LOW QUALITY PROTEIN: F-box protein DOR [Eutrema salsugineum]
MKSNVSGDRLTITRRNTRSRKSEEDGGESSSSSMPIPIDLVFEIFSRLPLKSIATCRCVSKLWSSILRRPDFTELFLTRSSARPQILFAGRRDGELFFSSSSEPKVPVSNSSPLVPYHARFTFDSSSEIRGHVHGLVCVENIRILEGKKEIVVVLCNPSTGQSLTLPNLKTRIIGVRSLFGYDPIDKQYKVLSMTRPRVEDDVECEDHQVLTLGGTGNLSWRTIKCCIPHYYLMWSSTQQTITKRPQ